MKKSSLVHGAWGAVALGSFLLGSQLFPAGRGGSAEASDADGGSKGSRSTGPRAGGPGLGVVGKGSPVGVDGKASSGNRGGSVQARLTEREVEALGEKFRTSSNPIERRLAFSRLLEGMTPENAKLMREQIAHLSAESAEFKEFHYAWGAIAGVEAVVHGADTPKPDMLASLAGWANADPATARSWFDGLEKEGEEGKRSYDNQQYMRWGMVHGLANADPDVASRFVYELAAGGDRDAERMMHTVAGAVMRTGTPAEVAQWSESLPSGDLRNSMLGRAAGHYARADPEAAADWAAGYIGQSGAEGMIHQVGGQWARRDPEAAVEWLEALPAGSASRGMDSAFSAWAGRDPTAAGEYLQAMPASSTRDSAISGYSARVAWEDPRAAIGWAESISSEGERLRAMTRAGQVWTRREPAAAAEWASSSGLPENVRQAILNPPRDRR